MKFAFGLCVFKILPRVFSLRNKPMTIPKMLIKKFDYGLFMFFMSVNGIFKVYYIFNL